MIDFFDRLLEINARLGGPSSFQRWESNPGEIYGVSPVVEQIKISKMWNDIVLKYLKKKRRNSMQLTEEEMRLAGFSTRRGEDEYPKEFTVKQVDNGFIAIVGCRTVVFTSQQELFDAMKLYLADPAKAEKKYVGGKA